jgi:hypothetical protein
MREAPLLQFTSRVDGKSADVRILTNRVEWVVAGRHRVTEMLPVVAISSVATGEDAGKFKVIVTTDTDTIEFQVEKTVATSAWQQLDQLIASKPGKSHVVPVTDGLGQVEKDSIAEELITLKWLLDAGIINDHDFQEERARLLGF